MLRLWMSAAVLFVAVTLVGGADEKPMHGAVKPAERLAQKGWKARHEKFLEQTKKGDIDVVFLGDSITQGWEGPGKKAWADTFAPMKAGNYGISGDQTAHVIWRLTEGKELDGITPKAAVIMIGTNNMSGYTAEQIADGITVIVKELQKQKPKMKILLLGIFPRGDTASKNEKAKEAALKSREKIKATNAIVAKLADDKTVFYKDIGDKFLEKEGVLPKEIMPDYLHLSPKGYSIWAEAIKADLEKLIK